MLATLVTLIVVACGAVRSVGAPPKGGFPTKLMTLPFNAAGRRAVVATAGTLLPRYGLVEAQAPLVLAGAFTSRSPIEYVVAALADSTIASGVIKLSDLNGAPHEAAALALASVEQLFSLAQPQALPLPRDAEVRLVAVLG